MTWFRVDDSFPSHPKTRSIPRGSRLAVIGTWTTLGAYSARHLTDGLITADSVIDEGGARPHAKALVTARLWHPPGVGCGHPAEECPGAPPEGHYQYHDWYVYQRSRADVLAERAAAAERMRRIRANGKRGKGGSAGGDTDLDGGDGSGDVRANVRPNFDRSSPVRSPNPGQARPDPGTYLLTLISRLAAGDVGPPPAEVIAGWQQVAGPGVDLDAEAMAYLVRFGDRPARDERGAWLGWLRKAAQHRDPVAKLGCGSCDGGWLGLDAELRPRPCPTCRPHLRAVGDAS